MKTTIDHRSLYRLPWNLADNPIAWLEPTQACNLACDGCYRQNVKEHKPIDEVQEDLDTFARLRNFDGVSIAGGDPLMHPEAVEIVHRVAAMGRKPILNTNGLALTREMLVELKAAGLMGLTFHVDSKQGRPKWRDKTEKQMNELRSEYAELVASVGGLACAFNSTVYQDTLHEVPDVLAWAADNIDKVHTIVFILFRAALEEGYDYYAWGEKVDMSDLVYVDQEERWRTDMKAPEVVGVIRERYPEFEPCAYLNGTEQPESFKWLASMRVGSPGRIHGYIGPKFMELSQATYHLMHGRYLSYAPPGVLATGRSVMAGGSLIDRGARTAALHYGKSLLTRPLDVFKTQHLQTVLIIQPIDLLPDGRQNMCDGCPDMTVHDGRLVWSCRLEEQRNFGQWCLPVPKEGKPVLGKTLPLDGIQKDAAE